MQISLEKKIEKFWCRTNGANREETNIRQVSKMAEHAYGHHEQSYRNNRCEEVVAHF